MQPFILCSIYKRFIDKQEQVFIEHTYLKNMGEKNEEMGPVYVGKASIIKWICSKVFVIGTFSPINSLDTETCGVKPFDIGDI